MAEAISVEGVSFAYGNGRAPIFTDFSLDVRPGEVVTLVGPSASGKSTLLHLIADHLAPSRGRVSRSGPCLVIYQRDALLPWLTVRENIEFARTYALKKVSEETASIVASFHLQDAL